MDALAAEILAEVPGTALASDQPYRELDLAVDFCEDVPPLPDAAIDRIVAAFHRRGATCKVSSIHVNGWFGDFDKLEGFRRFHRDAWGEDLDATRWAFFGDSANDEPMFAAFPLSVGVANVARFLPRMQRHPAWITPSEGGYGFVEGLERLRKRQEGGEADTAGDHPRLRGRVDGLERLPEGAETPQLRTGLHIVEEARADADALVQE